MRQGVFCGLLFGGLSLGRNFAEFQKMRHEGVLALPARLYYRDLEVSKLEALSCSNGDYNAIVYLSQLARDSLQWFVLNSHLYNGTRITKPLTVITMTTDASNSGWGVVCDGVTSSGLWSSEEQAMHINWLELSAVLFGLKCFVHSHNCLVKV